MADRLLLFIHGLGSTSEETWRVFEGVLSKDMDIQNRFDVDFFEYPAQKMHIPFFRPNILKIQSLSRALKSYVEAISHKYRDIILVCHSMGGLVARQYLLEEAQQQRNLKVVKIIYLAVPHTGAALASIAKYFCIFQLQIRQLCRESDFIDNLNSSWSRLGLDNAFSMLSIWGADDRVVSEGSASYCGESCNTRIVVGKDHGSIVCPVSHGDVMYIHFKKHIFDSMYEGSGGEVLASFIKSIKSRAYVNDNSIEYSVSGDVVSIKFELNGKIKIIEYEKEYVKNFYWDAVCDFEARISK